MLKIYEDELLQLKEKMVKAEKFAKKLPLFKDEILKNKYTGYENHIQFGSTYKNIFLAWGINRNHYVWDSVCTINNYEKDDKYNEYLFKIYVNNYNLFDTSDDELRNSLNDIQNKCNVYFYDKYNSTFYVEDKYIEEFLEVLNEWYLQARDKVKQYKRHEKIEKLKMELAELENEE